MARDPVKYKATLARWRAANPARIRGYWVNWKTKNPEKARKMQRLYRQRQRAKTRADCLTAYGGVCVCCGENEPRFLTIDHIDGKGARHRRRLKLPIAGSGYSFYDWLRKQGYPKDNYRLLCFNCNCGRHYNGGVCPHQQST